jgi:hypothetical protein
MASRFLISKLFEKFDHGAILSRFLSKKAGRDRAFLFFGVPPLDIW